MDNILWVGLGSALGGIFRYFVSMLTYQLWGRAFPYGTLVVNVLGCFFMGVLFVMLLSRFHNHAEYLRAALLIGLLGGFTTFSSFSLDTINLIENGELALAFLNIGISITLCLGATWIGMLWGRQL